MDAQEAKHIGEFDSNPKSNLQMPDIDDSSVGSSKGDSTESEPKKSKGFLGNIKGAAKGAAKVLTKCFHRGKEAEDTDPFAPDEQIITADVSVVSRKEDLPEISGVESGVDSLSSTKMEVTDDLSVKVGDEIDEVKESKENKKNSGEELMTARAEAIAFAVNNGGEELDKKEELNPDDLVKAEMKRQAKEMVAKPMEKEPAQQDMPDAKAVARKQSGEQTARSMEEMWNNDEKGDNISVSSDVSSLSSDTSRSEGREGKGEPAKGAAKVESKGSGLLKSEKMKSGGEVKPGAYSVSTSPSKSSGASKEGGAKR